MYYINRCLFALIFILSIVINSKAQEEKPPIVRQGLLKFTANIAPAVFFKPSKFALYLNGDIEFYLQKRVSVRGDINAFLGVQEKAGRLLRMNHSVFFGGCYHFGKRNFDPFIGFQPGISIVQGFKTDDLGAETTALIRPVPVVSAIVGMHYYVGRFFNFYLTVRYVGGKYFADMAEPISLHSLQFMAGLGFNINTMKVKK